MTLHTHGVSYTSLHNMMLKNKDSGLMISQSGLAWFPVTVNEEGVSEHFEKEDLFKRVYFSGLGFIVVVTFLRPSL